MERISPSRYVWFAGIVFLGVTADLATKAWIFDRLGMPGEQPTWWIIRDVFGFQTSLNEGALFGMGQGMVGFFAAMSIVAALGIMAWLFLGGGARDRFLNITLALITAGILGNLYDRLGLPGLVWNHANGARELGDPVYAVRDWVLVMIGSYHWPNFNVADSLLVCGAILLSWHAFFGLNETAEESGTVAEKDARASAAE